MNKNTYTSKFKFDRVIDTIKKDNVTETGRQYGVRPNLLSKWRSYFLNQGHKIFDTTPDQEMDRLKKRVSQLEQIVGKKEIELNLIKNFSDFNQSQNGT